MNFVKKTKNISHIILVILLFVLNSCNNDSFDKVDTISNDELLLSFNEAIKVYTSPKEPGSILIQQISFVGQPENVDNSYISEKSFTGTDKSSSNKLTLLDQNDIEILSPNKSLKQSNIKISDMFGKELTIYENGDGNSKSSTATAKTITLPNIITLNTSTNTIVPGTVISWNVDNSNNDGVIIVATYNPINQTNNSLAMANPLKIVRGIALSDKTGSYTVDASVLDDFPDNSKIDLLVARGVTTSLSGKAVTAITQSTDLIDINY